MSRRKRSCEPCSSNGTPTTKKRTVSKQTAEKWVKEFGKDLNTSVWLRFETADHDHVVSLSCALCTQFQDKLVGIRNYRTSFIDGTSNVRTSSFKEHATTDMHVRARKQQSTSVFQYAPIAKALAQLSMDKRTEERTKRKFDIAYLVASSQVIFSSVRAKFTLTGHSVWTCPKNNFEHCSRMQEWVIQIPSIPILVSVLFPSLHLKYFRIKFLLLVIMYNQAS